MKSSRELTYILGISLGTNCSVVLCNPDGVIEVGYEEERFTKNKRESAFPINSLRKCLEYIPSQSFVHIGFSHWFDNEDVIEINRYIIDVKEYIEKQRPDLYCTVHETVDHHYLHTQSCIPFLRDKIEDLKRPVISIVIDGFGNNQSVFSVFKYNSYKQLFDPYHHQTAVVRSVNLYRSLGLFYEAVTRNCGLKVKGDEYKLLGYESDIRKCFDYSSIEKNVEEAINTVVKCYFTNKGDITLTDDNLINYNALNAVDKYWDFILLNILSPFSEILGDDIYKTRVLLGYIGQSALERIVHKAIFTQLEYDNSGADLILSGGVFYNVKLNNLIINTHPGNVFICPVAGDQGGSIGIATYLYRSIFKRNPVINTLCIGKRSHTPLVETIINEIVDDIVKGKIVNLVHGEMEFGPRALCNTSTLCLPTKSNVKLINQANDRDEAMPMAPVLLERNLNHFFDKSEYSKVKNSLPYMITTLRFKKEVNYEQYSGVMHNHPHNEFFTGRPQVISDPESVIYKILDKVEERTGTKCLINTSYNVHGRPIVYSYEDGMDDFKTQHHNLMKIDSASLPLFTLYNCLL